LTERDNNNDGKGAFCGAAGSAQLLCNCAALTFVHGEENRRLAEQVCATLLHPAQNPEAQPRPRPGRGSPGSAPAET
jgi:hypothetical protein